MKELIGLGVILTSWALALYVGVYVLFIGGIIQTIQSATPIVIASGIAFGIAKILFAGVVGWCIAIFGTGIGSAIME